MWLNMPKSTTYKHNDKECFSLPIDISINKLTIYHNITARGWLFFFCSWGLSYVHKHLGIYWMLPVGLYKQPPCWKSPTDLFMM